LDKTITTALLIIAGIICSIFLFNSVYPMITRSSSAMTNMTDKINNRMQSQIEVIQATGSSSSNKVYIWAKNIGTSRVDAVEQSDLFLGPQGNSVRIAYFKNSDGSLSPLPSWTYNIENGSEWGTGSTIKITVTFTENLSPGTYTLKFVIPNGIQAEYYFSL
jgi:archaellum component FlaF (FlaF/FlaG flagellin family)